MKLSYKSTVFAGFIGYTTQAITINFAPLLFVTFRSEFGLSLTQISSLIAICFLIQMAIDSFASFFGNLLRPRLTVILAHIFAAAGLVGYGIFPTFLPPYPALILAVLLSGAGSGMVEVMITPIIESCPTSNKSGYMSLLHSFYCWGSVSVSLLSTLFFVTVGIEHWRLLACLWALVPLFGVFLFSIVPLYPITGTEGETDTHSYIKNGFFWLFFLMMLCAGASEISMSQWASTFAEAGLGVSKTLGDLLGPCLFAVLMGFSRVFYAKTSERINLNRFTLGSCILCLISYLLAALSPIPILSLIGCAMCGLSVGILWPGTISNASASMPNSPLSMFAFLALAGDIGCLAGPSLVGTLTDALGSMKASFLFSTVFPIFLIGATLFLMASKKKKQ